MMRPTGAKVDVLVFALRNLLCAFIHVNKVHTQTYIQSYIYTYVHTFIHIYIDT